MSLPSRLSNNKTMAKSQQTPEVFVSVVECPCLLVSRTHRNEIAIEKGMPKALKKEDSGPRYESSSI